MLSMTPFETRPVAAKPIAQRGGPGIVVKPAPKP